MGSDPEFMIKNQDGSLKSAIGIIKGTKEKRQKIGNGHQVYYDNVLAECAVKPGSSKEEVVENFGDCFRHLADLIRPYIILVEASGHYPESEVQHAEAQKFGCDPDMCAYKLEVNAPPMVPEDGFRTAGGHIHVGFSGGVGDEYETSLKRLWIIRMMDLFVGIPSLLMDNGEKSIIRRRLYGKAGCHRQCFDYGVEYRSLSNFWLASPKLVELMYDLCNVCVDQVLEGSDLIPNVEDIEWGDAYDHMELYETINSGNTKKAKKKFFPLLENYLSKDLIKRIKDELENKEGYNFYEEWELPVP